VFSVSFYSLAKDLSIPLIFNSFSIYLFIIFIYLIIFILVALGLCGAWAYLPQSVWDLSSPARDRTCILCIGRQIFNHWTTEEVSLLIFLFKLINVLLAALSPCCVRAFSSCGEYSLLPRSGFSLQWLLLVTRRSVTLQQWNQTITCSGGSKWTSQMKHLYFLKKERSQISNLALQLKKLQRGERKRNPKQAKAGK